MSAFDQINEFIRNHGGNVTSVPQTWPLRFDITPTQTEALMALLEQAGWRPRPRGTTTRVGYAGFVEMPTFTIAKPKDPR
jgi:hypothetical protein